MALELLVLIIGPLTAIVAVVFQTWWNERSDYKKARFGLIDEIERNVEYVNDLRIIIKRRLEGLDKLKENKKIPNIVRPFLPDAAYNYFLMNGYFSRISNKVKFEIHDLYATQISIVDYLYRHRAFELQENPDPNNLYINIKMNLEYLIFLCKDYEKIAINLKNITNEKKSELTFQNFPELKE